MAIDRRYTTGILAAMHAQVTTGLLTTGPAPKKTPRWKSELRILRRDGLRHYVAARRQLRRFHRAVDSMVASEGGGHDE